MKSSIKHCTSVAPRRRRLLLLPLFLLLLILAGSAPAQAAGDNHPAPSVVHDYTLVVNPASADVTMRLLVSPQLVPQVYRTIDTNFDALTSDDEQQAWLQAFTSGLSFEVDDKPASFNLVGAGKLTREALLLSMSKAITVTMRVDLGQLAPSTDTQPVEHHLILSDNSNYVGYDEYYATYTDGAGVVVTSHDLTNVSNPATFEAIFEIDPNAVAAVPPPSANNAPAQEPAGGTLLSQLDQFISQPRGDIGFAIFIFLLSVGVGALHALTPGHGKAVVAAYLAGSRGRVQDAAVLGLVVTVTHTSSVIALGLVLLLVNNFAMPRYLQPLLELISGLLIVVLGLWLLVQRWRATRVTSITPASQPATAQAPTPVPALAAAQSIPAHQAHAHSYMQGASVPNQASDSPINGEHVNYPDEHIHEHTHNGHTHAHHDGHEHSHDGQAHDAQEHSHAGNGHQHSHNDLVHSHGGHTHSHEVPANVSLRGLIALGISGGLIPCPDALAIMLLTAGVSQIGLGLALVTSFSVGLAVTLIGIGVLMVKSRSLLERLLPGGATGNPTWVTWLPVVSAIVVVLLGVVVMVGAAFGQKWV